MVSMLHKHNGAMPPEVNTWELSESWHFTPTGSIIYLCAAVAYYIYFPIDSSGEVNQPTTSCLKCIAHILITGSCLTVY
jgi:hypothetical protein